MTELSLVVREARVEHHAAVPTITVVLGATVPEAVEVGALALRCQVRIEPQRRRYSAEEGHRLYEQFGEPSQWGDSLRPFLWTHTSTVVPGFVGSTLVELPLVCTYDFDVAGAKYLASLADGEIPLVLLFSGTVFSRGPTGLSVEPIPWDLEASYRMPVAVWREAMDTYFPNSAWLRVDRLTFEELQRFRVSHGLPTWDLAIERLMAAAAETVR